MPKQYDMQQVCKNGHQITGCCNIEPEEKKEFCQTCGAPTITSCADCGKEIEGDEIESVQSWADARCGRSRMRSVYKADVPSYCSGCGKPYPWTESKITTAIQIFAEFGNLDENEKENIKQDINNIARDMPQAELSAMRIKRIWAKSKNVGYELIMEFASRTAANILKQTV